MSLSVLTVIEMYLKKRAYFILNILSHILLKLIPQKTLVRMLILVRLNECFGTDTVSPNKDLGLK